jgi:hypothetical protein
MFNAAFNMRRKTFFAELGNQLLFGLFVTLVCFGIYATLATLALKLFKPMMRRYAGIEPGDVTELPIEFDIMKTLIFSALLCSSDTVAAVSIVDFKS